MSRLTVLLRGYYGFGNLGDDLLLMTSVSLIKEWMPDAIFTVLSNSSRSDYVPKFLGEPVEVIDWRTKRTFDVMWDGGGGVFFDFERGGRFRELVNAMAIGIGAGRVASLATVVRFVVLKERRISARVRFGAGLGIGPYAAGSRKLVRDLEMLGSYDRLCVRDQVSAELARRFGIGDVVVTGSDLAFLTEKWLPSALTVSPSKGGRVGVVLRDWPGLTGNDWDGLWHSLERLPSEPTFYAFDQTADLQYLEELDRRGFTYHVWQPDAHSLEPFLSSLASNAVIATMRAHGAIVASCLGIPSVCLEVEPKLRIVHHMLPHSSLLVGPPFADLDQQIARAAELESGTRADVDRNRTAIRAAMTEFEKALHTATMG